MLKINNIEEFEQIIRGKNPLFKCVDREYDQEPDSINVEVRLLVRDCTTYQYYGLRWLEHESRGSVQNMKFPLILQPVMPKPIEAYQWADSSFK